MPLPATTKDTEWPPRDIKPYIDQATTAQAWYTGDHVDLETQSAAPGSDGRRRRFWQRRKNNDATKATARLHAPLAADIAAVSADLLFGEPVSLTVSDGQTEVQAEIERLEDDLGLANLLVEGAEIASATGGVYLRSAWDDQVADHGLLQTYDQKHAVPDFRYRRLWAVSLWEDVLTEGSVVYRHLERHERGRIFHGLYRGDQTRIGVNIPLTTLPQTKELMDEIVLPGRLRDRLLVSYVPNVLPNLLTPIRPIGRPDVAGAEDLLDAVDETWTSLMRDVRLGQARIVVDQEWLRANGGRPGQTKTLDFDTEVFTALNMGDAADSHTLANIQPDIRVTEHIDLALALAEQIISRAGYSPQTFGLKIEGRAESGTALNIREKKTDRTKSKKQRYWQPGVRESVENLLLIGAEVFNRPALPDEERVKVEWPESEQDPTEKAVWINTLRQARAMSIDRAVGLAQPDLTGDNLDEEIRRIKDEDQMQDPADAFPV